MAYKKSYFILNICVISILFLPKSSYSCAFHDYPPFGADWYHQYFYDLSFYDDTHSSVGFLYNVHSFERNFMTFTDADPTPRNTPLKESLISSTTFYRFHILKNLQAAVLISQTAINVFCLGDDQSINLNSSSNNQLGFIADYKLNSFQVKNWKTDIHFQAGGNTNINANNIFYAEKSPGLGWLAYDISKVSPRLIAGEGYGSVFNAGVTGIFQKKNFNIYTSESARFFTPDQQDFCFGNDFNSSLSAGWQLAIPHTKIKLETIAGGCFEYALTDWQKTLVKDPAVMSEGNDLLLSAGEKVSLGSFKVSVNYSVPAYSYGFSEFQLYTKSQLTLSAQLGF